MPKTAPAPRPRVKCSSPYCNSRQADFAVGGGFQRHLNSSDDCKKYYDQLARAAEDFPNTPQLPPSNVDPPLTQRHGDDSLAPEVETEPPSYNSGYQHDVAMWCLPAARRLS